ncbi:hypothetical protein CW357_09300 [Rummeliibacillus sp. TYF005]|nr:hypothetical protein D1606_08810 [Rummeliibacillus sp. POC4]RPJ95650.1 hypothetical protein CW357_09300 [Rummeliibacillus sp. TYF005]
MLLLFLILFTSICLTYALIKKRFIFLTFPVVALIILMIVKIILVPLPLKETFQFIFDLR